MKKKLLFISLVLLFGLVFSGAVSAADVYVNTTGNDATGTGTINNPYLSVSKGVSKVSNGGTVYIADGVYSGANNRGITINKNMTIRGQSEAGTIIDAQKLNRIFTIQTSYTVNMFNLTLRNGNVTNLGGSIENNGNLKLTHCTITNNYGGVSGGAIINNNMASLTVTDCTFNKNSVNFDEGNGGAIINHNLLTVTGSSFSQNSASCGGAIFTSDNGNSILNNCIFTDNVAQSSGGAVFNVVGTTTINNCAFNNNTALVEVGGAILNFGKVNIVNSIFNGNTADSGGAIFTDGFDDDTLIVTGSIFTNNVAKINPGGYGYGGAIFTSIGTLNFNAFFNNTAYSGNALYASDFPVNAVKNWWGSNDSPAGDICGPVNYSQWIVMQLSALPTIISPGETSTVTANFNRVNGGGILTGGHIPDGLGVLFISDHKGSVNPSLALTLNGVAITTYTAGFVEGGYSIVNATLHGQTVNTTIIIPNPVDLIPSNLVVPSNPYTMHNYKVYVDVTNDGTDATPNGFHVILQDNGNTVDEKWIAALAAKTTIYGLAFDWKPTSPGSHFLEVLVDPYSEVIEFDETNNAINTTRNVFTITQLIVNPVNCYTNDQVTLTAKLMDTAYNVPLSGKTINFKVNNVFVNSAVTDANGIASLAYTVTFLPNTYTIFGEFVQDSLYLGSDDTDNLNVRFTPTNITVNQVEGYWNDTVNLQATLTDTGHNRPLQNKEVNFKVNGNNIGSVFTNSQGIATLPYQIPLNTGNYPIVVTFTQDLIYLGTTNTTTLTVKSTPTKITITPKEGYWNDTIQITATLTDTHNNKPLQNKEIHFKINGNPIASIFTNTQGTATLPYQIPLNTGNYPIIVTFTTDQIYTGTTNTTTLTVKSTPTKITINPATGYWNDTITITATLTDTAPGHNNKPLQGKTIHFTIQGDPNTYHTITNATGTATLQYTITQNTGPYTITTTHDTDQIYTGTTNTTTLTVKSTPTKIVVSPVSGYDHDIVSLTATLTDTIHDKLLENKIIQFFVNGNPEGSDTTTSDGIAILSYTINLAAGNYTIFANFLGDDIYSNSNGTDNLNVILVVTSVNPANGTTTTNASQIITVTFNGPIESGSAYETISVKNSQGTSQTINKNIVNNQLIITVSSSYADGIYTLYIPINSITDLAGNPLQNPLNSTFTVDSTNPTITNVNPANNTITNNPSQTITITFNENIKPGTTYNNIILWNNNVNYYKPSTKTINGNTLTITPNTPLNNGHNYSILIPTNSITDLAGNPLQNPLNSTFTVDTTNPTITNVNPANNTITNNQSQTITITFNEAIKIGPNYNNIILWNNNVNYYKPSTKTINGNTLTITPNTPLNNGHNYSILIPTNSITDLAGNPLQNPLNSTFTVDETDPIAAPLSTVKLTFIHHSCGSNWLATGNGNLGSELNANNYYVTDTNYGWDAEPGDNLGDHTNTDDWDLWFNDDKMPYVYNNTSETVYDNTITNPGGENEIIMFKSCYPLSEVGSSIEDEKTIYNNLKTYFASQPDKMFMLITPPGETTVSSYQLTKELCNWLVDTENGWLSDYIGNNVYVFDLYCVLSETNSHHRYYNGEIEYVYAADYDGTSPYHNGDDHPNIEGNQKATTEFIGFLNYAYNTWRS